MKLATCVVIARTARDTDWRAQGTKSPRDEKSQDLASCQRRLRFRGGIFFGTAGSGPEGDDLLYYSEQVGNGRYFGLVEFEGDIAPDTWTVIHLSQTHRVLVRDGAARFRDLTEDQSEPLSAVGGRFAVGEAVEFYLPLEALETQTPTAHRVERRPDEDGRPGEQVLDELE